MSSAARRRTTEADVVILELIRLVTREPWNVHVATDRLMAKRHSVGALWRARARVLRSQTQSPSLIGERAESVLHALLGRLAENRPATAALARSVERFQPAAAGRSLSA